MEKTMGKLAKIKTFYLSHKKTSIIILIVFVLLCYWGYKKFFVAPAPTRYVTTIAQKGTIVSSVTGTGQVSTSNQIDLKSKNSGTITYVGVSSGDQVKKGKLLFSIDARTATKAVRDAETNLISAKLDLEAAKVQNNNTDTNQQTSVNNAYNNLLNSSLEAVPVDNTINSSSSVSAPTISGNYVLGKEGVINIHFYNSSGGTSFSATGLTNGSGLTSSYIAEPIGDSGLYLKIPTNFNGSGTDWVINIPNKNASNYLSNYNSYQSALQNQAQSDSSSQTNLLNIKAKELSVAKAENALQDAKDSLSDYSVYAPFDGVIASVSGKVGDISSGALGTIITNQKIATITLNEVDVAKIKLKQKVTLTFDAVADLTITGEVAEIDSVGTVSSGVVNYTVKINFDTQDDRVKSGMSVSASIITGTAQDVITVPNSAVKTKNNVIYVETFSAPLTTPLAGVQGSPSNVLPTQVEVVTGLSDDTSTEITSGLKEGDIVITKTIGSSTTKTTTPSILNSMSGNRGGGGASAGSSTKAMRLD